MGTYSVRRTFLGINVLFFNTFSCLGILYMYIHFRPKMITENDRNYLKKIKDLIDIFSLGGKVYANRLNRPNFAFVKAVLVRIYLKVDYQYWLVSTSVDSQNNVENVTSSDIENRSIQLNCASLSIFFYFMAET